MKKIFIGILDFSYKQLNSCIFGISLLLLIATTALFYPVDAVMSRYDFLAIAALVIQILFILFKVETLRESAMIFIFHFLGMTMEIFKTKMGSWSYSQAGVLYLYGVPLFTGFMYASVGSYILRFQRNFHCTFVNFPSYPWILLTALLAYINFMSHHYIWDLRWLILGLSMLIFWRTTITFDLTVGLLKLPFLMVLISIGGLLWVAENIGTFYTIWTYPHQINIWQMVSPQKIISWYLLVLTALAIVYGVYPVARGEENASINGAFS